MEYVCTALDLCLLPKARSVCLRNLGHFYIATSYVIIDKTSWIFSTLNGQGALNIIKTMVLILEGNWEIDAHVRSNLCYSICLWHLIRLRAVTNRTFFSLFENILFHACATYSEIPSYISAMIQTYILFTRNVLPYRVSIYIIYLSACSCLYTENGLILDGSLEMSRTWRGNQAFFLNIKFDTTKDINKNVLYK